MYIHTHMYIHTNIYTQTYIFIHTHTYMLTHTHTKCLKIQTSFTQLFKIATHVQNSWLS